MKKVLIAGAAGKCANYSAALSACGADVKVSLDEGDAGDFGALLLPGGGDVDPRFFGQGMDGSDKPDRELDERQFALLKRFVQARKPVLGICRGHQVINVFFRGDLIQDLKTAGLHTRRGGDVYHATTAGENTFLSELYGTRFVTNSSHHQGLGRLGEGLAVVQRADGDGVVEGICHETLPVLGVQWHPERIFGERREPGTADGKKLFLYFLSLTRDGERGVRASKNRE